jgi:hypothetical protein
MRVPVLLAAVVFAASPVAAKGVHHRHSAATCEKVKNEIAAGKSPEDVAKDMKISSARVRSCTNPKHPRKTRKEHTEQPS